MDFVINPFTHKLDAIGTGIAPGDVLTIQGDAGAAVGGDGAGNISLLGNANGLNITGTPLTNTLDVKNLRALATYVVDPVAGETEYTSIQTAINAASTAGGDIVYIRYGTYTENLTMADNVNLVGALGKNCIIIGNHTVPDGASFSTYNLTFEGTGNLFSNAGTGSVDVTMRNCIVDIDTGFIFDFLNVTTGNIFFSDCVGNLGTDCAILNTTGTIFLVLEGSWAGTNLTAGIITNGSIFVDTTEIVGPIVLNGSASSRITESYLNSTITTNDSATYSCIGNTVSAGASPCVVHNSSATITLQDSVLITQVGTCITGSGSINMDLVVMSKSSTIAATVTKIANAHMETGDIHIGAGTSDNASYLDIADSKENTSVDASVYNQIATGTLSNSRLSLKVGGATNGDPCIRFQNVGGDDYSFGHDSSDSAIKITDGAHPSTGNTLWQLEKGGELTLPQQPAFLAYNSATFGGVTGDGTVISPYIFDSEKFDIGGNYNTTTGIFIAPVTGKYEFSVNINFSGLSVLNNGAKMSLITTSDTHILAKINPGVVRDASNQLICNGSILVAMSAGDSATVEFVVIGNATANVSIRGSASPITFFSGYLRS